MSMPVSPAMLSCRCPLMCRCYWFQSTYWGADWASSLRTFTTDSKANLTAKKWNDDKINDWVKWPQLNTKQRIQTVMITIIIKDTNKNKNSQWVAGTDGHNSPVRNIITSSQHLSELRAGQVLHGQSLWFGIVSCNELLHVHGSTDTTDWKQLTSV